MASGPVVLVGAGNMGGAMLRGWLASGVEAQSIAVIDPSPVPAMQAYLDEQGIACHGSVPDGLLAAALFIAVKPQMMDKVLPAVSGLIGADTVCVSIAAGTSMAVMSRHLGDVAIVRAMPNTPAMIGRGITAALPNARVTGEQHELTARLLAVCGPVEWVETEDQIDAVTAVSGSGPAYVYYLAECMADAGRKLGLDADLAMRLARATVAGAGEMMHRSDEDAAVLRKNVTSPGGTTAAALEVMMKDDAFQGVLDEALAAAKQRAHELAEHG